MTPPQTPVPFKDLDALIDEGRKYKSQGPGIVGHGSTDIRIINPPLGDFSFSIALSLLKYRPSARVAQRSWNEGSYLLMSEDRKSIMTSYRHEVPLYSISLLADDWYLLPAEPAAPIDSLDV